VRGSTDGTQGGGSSGGGARQPAAAPASTASPAPAQATRPATVLPTGAAPTPVSRSRPAGTLRGQARGRGRSTATPRNGAARLARSAAAGAVAGVIAERVAPTSAATASGSRPADAASKDARPAASEQPRGGDERGSLVKRTVRDVVEVVPDWAKALVGALAALSLALGLGYFSFALRARRLDRQRHELLQEVGLLQTALLPPVPSRIGGLRTSVAYRPADGPGAGGDFYDALALPGGRAGFVLGDVSGHGRDALARTAFLRYTLRAYLEAGLEPRVALQVAGRVLEESLDGDFATVILAVHDPGSGSLTYASAGHPAPVVSGPVPFEPVLAASSPPIGVGLRTGVRQTTIPLVPGSVACMYTDGLAEARTERGILGRGRLGDILAELGRDATAPALIDRVAAEARAVPDDMACCVVAPAGGVTAGGFRTEQLELCREDVEAGLDLRFLEACGMPTRDALATVNEARSVVERFGGAVLHVTYGTRSPQVEVLPRNVVSIEAASRRAGASV
jgi:stage II sporulation SpoE-like protein